MLSMRGVDIDKVYALQVQGNSMIEDMVQDGDVVIMQTAEEAHNGETVAVWLADDEEVTLKKFYHEKDHIILRPANPTMDDIIIEDSKSIEIQGKVLMVISSHVG